MAALVWAGAAVPLPAQTAAPAVPPNPRLMNAELLARGRVVYQNHCVGCHGEKGDGNGPAAYGLMPKPRNFTTGLFKFRSTPSGMLPTDEDLVRTVRQGVLGTSMPAFALMPSRDVLAVVQYIKTFSPAWENPALYALPIPIPAPPTWFADEAQFKTHAEEGRKLFMTACAPCHGENGDGHGPSAATLLDSWGQPITPADLRRPFIRSGRTLSDVYKAMVTGITGTPMPSFQEALSEEQIWNLVAFVERLRREKTGRPTLVMVYGAGGAGGSASTSTSQPAKQETVSEYE